MFSRWIEALAHKNFDTFIHKIEVALIGLILFLVMGCTYVALFPIAISVPIHVQGNKAVVDSKFVPLLAGKKSLSIQTQEQPFEGYDIEQKQFLDNGNLVVRLNHAAPISKKYRVLLYKQSLVSMLFKSKAI
ncbi:MAG: hypothetical protein AB7F28_08475 [Candidatus Margulisiibacteriota bacterium]